MVQWAVHRLINRLTARAEFSLLPQLRNGMVSSRFVPTRTAGRVRRGLVRRPRRSPTDDVIADDAAAARAGRWRTRVPARPVGWPATRPP